MKRTPLYDTYRDYDGVKLVDFGGWELPLHFAAGISGEHIAVRTRAGLFDVSHMGECVISGEGATDYLEYLCTNAIADLEVGRCRYTMMCYPNGTVVDDILVYHRNENTYLLVLNASNTEKDLSWIMHDNPRASHCPEVIDISDTTACSLQAEAQEILKLGGGVGRLRASPSRASVRQRMLPLISRTSTPVRMALRSSATSMMRPALEPHPGAENRWAPPWASAADSLRIEAKLPLYGHEISDAITPLRRTSLSSSSSTKMTSAAAMPWCGNRRRESPAR